MNQVAQTRKREQAALPAIKPDEDNASGTKQRRGYHNHLRGTFVTDHMKGVPDDFTDDDHEGLAVVASPHGSTRFSPTDSDDPGGPYDSDTTYDGGLDEDNADQTLHSAARPGIRRFTTLRGRSLSSHGSISSPRASGTKRSQQDAELRQSPRKRPMRDSVDPKMSSASQATTNEHDHRQTNCVAATDFLGDEPPQRLEVTLRLPSGEKSAQLQREMAEHPVRLPVEASLPHSLVHLTDFQHPGELQSTAGETILVTTAKEQNQTAILSHDHVTQSQEQEHPPSSIVSKDVGVVEGNETTHRAGIAVHPPEGSSDGEWVARQKSAADRTPLELPSQRPTDYAHDDQPKLTQAAAHVPATMSRAVPNTRAQLNVGANSSMHHERTVSDRGSTGPARLRNDLASAAPTNEKPLSQQGQPIRPEIRPETLEALGLEVAAFREQETPRNVKQRPETGRDASFLPSAGQFDAEAAIEAFCTGRDESSRHPTPQKADAGRSPAPVAEARAHNTAGSSSAHSVNDQSHSAVNEWQSSEVHGGPPEALALSRDAASLPPSPAVTHQRQIVGEDRTLTTTPQMETRLTHTSTPAQGQEDTKLVQVSPELEFRRASLDVEAENTPVAPAASNDFKPPAISSDPRTSKIVLVDWKLQDGDSVIISRLTRYNRSLWLAVKEDMPASLSGKKFAGLERSTVFMSAADVLQHYGNSIASDGIEDCIHFLMDEAFGEDGSVERPWQKATVKMRE